MSCTQGLWLRHFLKNASAWPMPMVKISDFFVTKSSGIGQHITVLYGDMGA